MHENAHTERIKFHPLFHWISLGIGVLGIALAVYFYINSERRRSPMFFVQSGRNIIVDRQLSIGDKLQVSYDGVPLEGSRITAVQCQFWNAGREPIRTQDVLQPIRITLGQGAQILEAIVIKQSRPDSVKFEVSPEKDSKGGRTGIANVRFNILEINDGATIQIVYTGDPKAELQFTGTIIEATIKRLQLPLEIQQPNKPNAPNELRSGMKQLLLLLPISLPLTLFLTNVLTGLTVGLRHGFSGFKAEILDDFRTRLFWIAWTILSIACLSFYFYFFNYVDIPENILR